MSNSRDERHRRLFIIILNFFCIAHVNKVQFLKLCSRHKICERFSCKIFLYLLLAVKLVSKRGNEKSKKRRRYVFWVTGEFKFVRYQLIFVVFLSMVQCGVFSNAKLCFISFLSGSERESDKKKSSTMWHVVLIILMWINCNLTCNCRNLFVLQKRNFTADPNDLCRFSGM